MQYSSGCSAVMSDREWDPAAMTKDLMDERIRVTLLRRNWRRLIALIKRTGVPFDQLKVAEVGCGSGTCSLMIALLGASVTLIDCNENVLRETRKWFDAYGAAGDFVQADCLEQPPAALMGKYHLVISGGLAEHFAGKTGCGAFGIIGCSSGITDSPASVSPIATVPSCNRFSLFGECREPLESPWRSPILMKNCSASCTRQVSGMALSPAASQSGGTCSSIPQASSPHWSMCFHGTFRRN
jgi:hypothetical protein